MRLNIVLDLDLTLLCTHPDKDDEEDNKKKEDPKDKYKRLNLFSKKENRVLRDKVYKVSMLNSCGECVGEKDDMYGVYRPYLKEFLKFLNDDCDNIIVWTAGMRSYGYYISDNIFFKSKKKPILIYTKINRGVAYKTKPLKDLFEEDICKEKNINEKNTIIIDDNPETYVYNKRNAVPISGFECDIKKKDILENKDNELLKIIKWAKTKEVLDCQDIRLLDKSKIFTRSIEEYDEILKNEK
jgi:hypothetical protein